jgi:hypothetical protein
VRAKAVLTFGAEKLVDAMGIARGLMASPNWQMRLKFRSMPRPKKITVSLRQQTGIYDCSENHKSSIYG